MDTKWPVSTDGGREPLWSRDGTELFYRNGNRMMVVPVELEPTFKAGQSSLVFEGVYELGNGLYTNYDVSPDGQELLMIEQPDEAPAPGQIVVIPDFASELEAKFREVE